MQESAEAVRPGLRVAVIRGSIGGRGTKLRINYGDSLLNSITGTVFSYGDSLLNYGSSKLLL